MLKKIFDYAFDVKATLSEKADERAKRNHIRQMEKIERKLKSKLDIPELSSDDRDLFENRMKKFHECISEIYPIIEAGFHNAGYSIKNKFFLKNFISFEVDGDTTIEKVKLSIGVDDADTMNIVIRCNGKILYKTCNLMPPFNVDIPELPEEENDMALHTLLNFFRNSKSITITKHE